MTDLIDDRQRIAPTPEHEGDSVRMNMIQAINSAMDVMMARDPDVIVMGEDVGYFGGVFRATAGLQAKYGKRSVFDTPRSEEHTSELQSLLRISYAVFRLQQKQRRINQ